MNEAEVQRLMGLAERLRAEAMAMGSFPDDAQAGRVEVARAALESALRELQPAPAAPEVPADARDAARYRWLRDRDERIYGPGKLDAFIDAAMAAPTPQEKP